MKTIITLQLFLAIVLFGCKKEDTLIFSVNPQKANALVPIKFSTKNNGNAHTWQFGDGTSDAGKEVTHIFKLQGIYTVTLNVDGKEAKQYITVE